MGCRYNQRTKAGARAATIKALVSYKHTWKARTEQEQYLQKLVRDTSAFGEQDRKKELRQQNLLSDVSTLEKQEQEQYQQRLRRDATALKGQEQAQERQRQKLISNESALKEGEQEQE